MRKYINTIKIKKSLGLLLLVMGSSINGYTQSIPATNISSGTLPCFDCAPTGWSDFGGTPDMSNATTAATSGTSGGGTPWTNGPLPLPPNNHTDWISIRDIGTAGTEESIGTNITGLTSGREYELVAYTLSAIGTYSPAYIDEIDFQVGTYPRETISPINQDTDGVWGVTRFKFIANAPTMQFVFFPGNNAVGSNYESVNISVTLNAINTIPVVEDKNANTNWGTPVTIDVFADAMDYDAGQSVVVNTIDLNTSTTGIQDTITIPGEGTWVVDHITGVVTFTPELGFVGTATIQYTIQDDFTLDGNPSPGTSTPKNINVTVTSAITAGAIIGDQSICPNTQPTQITSTAPGTTPTGTISYRWEESTNGGTTWANIPAANGINYQPLALLVTTSYRRITVATTGSGFFESIPTNTVTVTVDFAANCIVCTADIDGESFNWSYTGPTDPTLPSNPMTQTTSQPAANGGFVFDIYELDNSFNMEINGVDLATQEIEFHFGLGGQNIRFVDGSYWGDGTIPNIWDIDGDSANPTIRVVISPTGAISMFGSKISVGPLFPLELYNTNTFNPITWNPSGSNTVIITQSVVGPTHMKGYGSGKNIVPCETYTLEKDGMFNNENGDGYAQAGESITYTFALINKGDIDIKDVVLNDPMLGGTVTATPTGDINSDNILNTTETWTYTANYTITQMDINNGGVYNQATAQGKNTNNDDLASETSADPTPLLNTDPNYDPTRPEHTFVLLKAQRMIITNPMLPSKARTN